MEQQQQQEQGAPVQAQEQAGAPVLFNGRAVVLDDITAPQALGSELMTAQDESRILKALSAFMSDGAPDFKAPAGAPFMVLDSANVCGVIARSEQGARVLARFGSEEQAKQKIPAMDYGGRVAKYSAEYLKRLLALMLACGDESITLAVARDYPLTMKTRHFSVVLAPRVEND
jgi:hypothetical protein